MADGPQVWLLELFDVTQNCWYSSGGKNIKIKLGYLAIPTQEKKTTELITVFFFFWSRMQHVGHGQ